MGVAKKLAELILLLLLIAMVAITMYIGIPIAISKHRSNTAEDLPLSPLIVEASLNKLPTIIAASDL